MKARRTSRSPSWRTIRRAQFHRGEIGEGKGNQNDSSLSAIHGPDVPDGIEVRPPGEKGGERPFGEFHHCQDSPFMEEAVDLFGEHPEALLDLPDVRFDAGHGVILREVGEMCYQSLHLGSGPESILRDRTAGLCRHAGEGLARSIC